MNEPTKFDRIINYLSLISLVFVIGMVLMLSVVIIGNSMLVYYEVEIHKTDDGVKYAVLNPDEDHIKIGKDFIKNSTTYKMETFKGYETIVPSFDYLGTLYVYEIGERYYIAKNKLGQYFTAQETGWQP